MLNIKWMPRESLATFFASWTEAGPGALSCLPTSLLPASLSLSCLCAWPFLSLLSSTLSSPPSQHQRWSEAPALFLWEQQA